MKRKSFLVVSIVVVAALVYYFDLTGPSSPDLMVEGSMGVLPSLERTPPGPRDVAAFGDLLEAGDAYYKMFDNARAIESYAQAYQIKPEDEAVLRRLVNSYRDYGLDLAAQDRRKEAESVLRRAVSFAEKLRTSFPNTAESHFLLASSRGSLADFVGGKKKVEIGREVELLCQQTIEMNPQHAPAYAVLGLFYREVSSLNWIQRSFAKMLLGGVPKATKDDAVEMLTEAVEIDPTLSFAHYQLAVTYASIDQRNRALPHLRKVLELAPRTSQDLRNQVKAKNLLEEWGQN